MKETRNCKIVQDLLPNYIEKLTNEETNKYIEEHLKECDDCKKVLENMKKSIQSDTTSEPKKSVKFMKKYKNKFTILKVILLVVLIIFIFTIGRKMIILSNLYNKANENINYNNYHEVQTIYMGENLEITNLYYKNGKTALISNYMSNDVAEKMMEYINGKNIKVYNEYDGKKTVSIETIENEDEQLKIGIAGNYFYNFNNLWEIFLLSLHTSVKNTTCNGIDCYLITENYYTDSIMDSWQSDWIYIDKATGLTVRSESGTITSESGKITNMITDYSHEFGTVTNDIFVEPDISEYELIEE